MASGTTRILIVDDHGVIREGIACLLERVPSVQVVGAADSGKEAIKAALLHKPDIILMDLVLPDFGGVDATQRILAVLPTVRIIILSMCRTPEHVYRAMRAGASGYVLKQSAAAELLAAITGTMKGDRYLSPAIRHFEQSATEGSDRSPMESLSAREREVLHLTVASMTSDQIAKRLNLSNKTVATYRSRIMQKLGVTDRTALIRYVLQHEITPP